MNKNILLGLGAIGGAVYLATSKKAQAKVKKTTGLSDSGKEYVKTYLSKVKPTASMYKNLDKSSIDSIKREYQWLKKRENKRVFIRDYDRKLFNKKTLSNDEKYKAMDRLGKSIILDVDGFDAITK